MKLFKRKTKEQKSYKENNKTNSKYYSILKTAEQIANMVLEEAEKINPTPEEFKNKTKEFQKRLKENKESLDKILVEAFVYAYKAVEKIYGISLYKVQIMGGYVLHLGDIAEMKTGEGKTLTAILPAYLNALEGNPVHIVTVNEYLSQRDAFNTGKVFALLGLTTGSVTSEQKPFEKKEQYEKDITYVTNSELGFDYLRDNMVGEIESKTQRGFYFAIVDEVDSILIDEARTPLIISSSSSPGEEIYVQTDEFAKSLNEEDYLKDNETKTIYLSDSGVEKAKDFFNVTNLYSFQNSQLVHRIFNALQANYLYKFDVDYTVKDDEIVLIDIFTGRLLPGRSYSEGLNQAIEAKEKVKIKPETKTIASVTYQNLFRMYKKLSGMTGTAATEEDEFIDIYNMRVVSIPTNKPVIREDQPDLVFASKEAKFENVVKKIAELNKKQQPVLVGTKSVYDSELISKSLKELEIPHSVLNAKNNASEATIIEAAGQKGSITISTNMAGRGTDIKLGEGVLELGGLFVLGTERYESRRIDNQLRGRSGRQGDVGITQFYISLEDDIMLQAGLKRIKKFMGSLDKDPVKSSFITRSIKIAQKKIEGINYDYRKNVVEYDDVLNRQRLIVYSQRDEILKSNKIDSLFINLISQFLKKLFKKDEFFEDSKLNLIELNNYLTQSIFVDEDSEKLENLNSTQHEEQIQDFIEEEMIKIFKNNLDKIEAKSELFTYIKRNLIAILDTNWQEQIDELNRLRTGIHYRQYAQQNPVQVYLLESNELFEEFKWKVLEQSISIIFNFTKHYSNRKIIKREPRNNFSDSKDKKTKELMVG